ncbi:hypothetical protein [Mongoliitalea daihaiensis]|nr:hypothetical protein [Mongoliitalea daihaiensis]UJP63608.1 hypothetical protein IPZ59_12250 [Mongoliitalea daihaiensis]
MGVPSHKTGELANQWSMDTEEVMSSFKAQLQALEDEVKGLVPVIV